MRIIQCKNWAADKIIHEKHIFQLYGTCILYELEDRSLMNNIKGIFVTSCNLSGMAKACADRLGIEVIENKKLEPFPSIKCVNREGELIYHLPFDQQYDKIKMRLNKGDFYCDTVREAEKKGFRRAYRWRGDS